MAPIHVRSTLNSNALFGNQTAMCNLPFLVSGGALVLLAVVGNLLMLVRQSRTSEMRKTTSSIYLRFLSVADILACLIFFGLYVDGLLLGGYFNVSNFFTFPT